MRRFKFLVVEDAKNIQILFNECLSPYGEVIQALTLEEAEAKFKTESEGLTHILIGGQLGPIREYGKPDTAQLVMHIRKTFSGPLIAFSSDDTYNNCLIKSGCSHSVYKGNSLAYVMNLLKTSATA